MTENASASPSVAAPQLVVVYSVFRRDATFATRRRFATGVNEIFELIETAGGNRPY
jgi:hypothetical protein